MLYAGLKREVREELGKDIAVGDPFSVFTYMNEVKGAHSIEVCYFAQFTGELEEITLEPADHMGYGWFTEDEEPTFAVNRQPGDKELDVIRKGLALLKGGKLSV